MKYPQIIIPTRLGIRFVKENDILACRANGNYTTLCLRDGRQHVITKKLKEIEQVLTDGSFFRIHHSHMINLSHLVSMNNGTDLKVVLSDGMELEVSKRKRSDFMSLFTKF